MYVLHLVQALILNKWWLTSRVKTGAINYYAPMIFRDLGLSSTTTALFAQGIYGVVKVVTCLIFIFFLADSLGRRMSFIWSGILQSFCMLFLGFVSLASEFQTPCFCSRLLTSCYTQYVRFGPKPGENSSPPPAGIAALAMVYIFAAAFNMGWGPVCKCISHSTLSLNVIAVRWLANLSNISMDLCL